MIFIQVLCTTEMRVLKVMPDGHFLSWCKRITIVILHHFTEKRTTLFLHITQTILLEERTIQEIWSTQELSARAKTWGCEEKNLASLQSMENTSKIIFFRLF